MPKPCTVGHGSKNEYTAYTTLSCANLEKRFVRNREIFACPPKYPVFLSLSMLGNYNERASGCITSFCCVMAKKLPDKPNVFTSDVSSID